MKVFFFVIIFSCFPLSLAREMLLFSRCVFIPWFVISYFVRRVCVCGCKKGNEKGNAPSEVDFRMRRKQSRRDLEDVGEKEKKEKDEKNHDKIKSCW